MDSATGSTLDLFSEDNLRSMIHSTALRPEIEAARAIIPKVDALQQAVIAAFRRLGTLTDEQLEQLGEFKHYAPSTLRKRRSELADVRKFDPPIIVAVGVVKREGRTSITAWALNENNVVYR